MDRAKPLPDAQRAMLNLFLKQITPFRELRGTMPLQYVTAFLLVATDPGQNVSEYARRAGTSQSLMSRHLADLGALNRHHQEGHGLVETYEDGMDRRNAHVRLTAKGRHLVTSMATAL